MYWKKIMTWSIMILVGLTLQAQEYSPNRWIEIQRLDANDNKEIAYSDTLFINYSGSDEMKIRKSGYAYNGKIVHNTLNIGALQYKILNNNNNEIRLSKDNVVHVFNRMLLDKSAVDAPTKFKDNKLPTEVVASIDWPLLIGEWEAYKRVSRSGPMPKIDFKLLIKKAVFYELVENEAKGVFYTTTKENYLYSVINTEKGTLNTITLDGTSINLKVFKADGKELIVEGHYGVLYFMRKI